MLMENKWQVYIHINKINNKKYVGITSEKNPNKRWKNGLGYKRQIFYKAIQKYGWNNFQHKILFINLTEQQAKQKEIELIALYNTNNSLYGYNQTAGGDAVPEKTNELKLKISNSLKKYYQTDKGKKERVKLSKQQKEYYLTHKNPFKSKKHSAETRKIMSEKAKIRKPNNRIAIQMFDDNGILLKTFDSKKDALNYLNITCYKPLTRAIELHTKYKNYYWKKEELI